MLGRALLALGVVGAAIVLAVLWNVFGSWPVPSSYSFPGHSMFGGGPTALFDGALQDVDGCIRTAGDPSFAVVWPPGYWLTLDDGEPVVHGFLRELRMGEPVRMGGGFYEDGEPPPGSRAIGRCAPPYFLSTGFEE